MNRTRFAETNNQDWYRGQAFCDNGRDPEFREIARGFLCGDVTGHGALTDPQKALIRLTALTACQTWKPLARYTRSALDMGAAPEELRHIQDYLSAYCFGDFYTRGALDLKTRELITFCAICCLGGCEPQARAHAGANLRVGNTRQTPIDALTQCLPFIGFPRTLNGLACI